MGVLDVGVFWGSDGDGVGGDMWVGDRGRSFVLREVSIGELGSRGWLGESDEMDGGG